MATANEDVDTHLTGSLAPTPTFSYEVATAKDFSYLRFTRGDGFKAGLSQSHRIMDGRTVGQAERDAMHEKLDAWIEENLR